MRRDYLPPRPAHSGFTLLEALLALLILGFGLVAIARLQVGLLVESRHTKSLAEAATLARSQIESIRFQIHRNSSAGLQRLAGNRTHTGVHETYKIEWVSTPAPGSAYSEATVQIFWNDRFRPNNLRISTLIAEPAPFISDHLFPATSPARP